MSNSEESGIDLMNDGEDVNQGLGNQAPSEQPTHQADHEPIATWEDEITVQCEQAKQRLAQVLKRKASSQGTADKRKSWKRRFRQASAELVTARELAASVLRLSKSVKTKAVSDTSTDLEARQAESDAGTRDRMKVHALPATITKFKIDAQTTEQALWRSLTVFEAEMRAQGTPQLSNGRCRWADGLLRVFEESPLQVGQIEWVSDTLISVEPQPAWDLIKETFVAKFKRAHDRYEAVRALVNGTFAQGDQDVMIYLHEFTKRVTLSLAPVRPLGDGGPSREADPAGWGKEHPVYALLFVNGLRQGLRDELVKEREFKAASEEGLASVAQLAASVEEKQRSAKLFSGRNGTITRTGSNPGGSGRPGTRGPGTSGGTSASKVKCLRCGREHLGGAKQCWSTRHVDGTVIQSPATATAPQGFSAKRKTQFERSKSMSSWSAKNGSGADRTCHLCGQAGHIQRDCPARGQLAKVARVLLGKDAKSLQGGGDIDVASNNSSGECFVCGSGTHRGKDCPLLATARKLKE